MKDLDDSFMAFRCVLKLKIILGTNRQAPADRFRLPYVSTRMKYLNSLGIFIQIYAKMHPLHTRIFDLILICNAIAT